MASSTPSMAADLVAAGRHRSAKAAVTFSGAALEAQAERRHEWILAGPAETGKTFAALWRLDALLRATPKARAVFVRKVRADMGGTVLATWRRVTELRGTPPETYGGAHPEWYGYPNGAQCFVAGMDRPGKVLSGEFDWVYVNQAEELGLDDWETLSTRVTGRGAVTPHPMLFGDCNPGPPTHWILSRPALRVMHSRHEDNPTLYAGGEWTEQGRRTLEILDSLTGVRRERLRFGRWVAAEGVVYEEFDRAVHVIEPFPIPSDWRRIRAVDFGYTNPFVCQWWAIDPDGRAYLYRELYRAGRIVEDHARAITRLSAGESIEATVADHDAEDRATMARHGIVTVAARKAVSQGIQAVQARLRKAGDGRPRLYLMRNALLERDESLVSAHRPVCTAEEFESYSWPKGADGRAVKEEPVKSDDHGLDALRYAVMHLESAVAASVSTVRVGRGQTRGF